MWRPMAWMTGAGLAAWIGGAGLSDATHPEAFLGIAGPLASANISWVAMVRARTVGMDRLMAVMMRGMAVKMVLFAAYVVIVLTMVNLRPVPFVAFFTTGFIGLYALEAYFLKRLIETDIRQPAT